jgi:hypothetical protein
MLNFLEQCFPEKESKHHYQRKKKTEVIVAGTDAIFS